MPDFRLRAGVILFALPALLQAGETRLLRVAPHAGIGRRVVAPLIGSAGSLHRVDAGFPIGVNVPADPRLFAAPAPPLAAAPIAADKVRAPESPAVRDPDFAAAPIGDRRDYAAGPDADSARGPIGVENALSGCLLFDGQDPRPGGGRAHHEEMRRTLIILGYRFDAATGRMIAPGRDRILTTKNWSRLRNRLLEGQRRLLMMRLSQEHPGSAGWTALTASNSGLLKRKIDRALEKDPAQARILIQRRLLSLYRRWLAIPIADSPESAAAAGDEQALDALIADNVVSYFSQYARGRKLLDGLRVDQGELRLPSFKIVRLGAAWGAMYTSYGRQLLIDLDMLRYWLTKHVSEPNRARAREALSTESGALAYLLAHPHLAGEVVRAIEVYLFHELVHFGQDLRRPFWSVLKCEGLPKLTTTEQEYEAYFEQNLFIHEKLSLPDAVFDIQQIESYWTFIADLDRWKENIDRYYAEHSANLIVPLRELRRLHDGLSRLLSRLAGPEGARSPSAAARIESLDRGRQAIEIEDAYAVRLMERIRREWPGLSSEGLRRQAEINERLGRYPHAAESWDALAKIALTQDERNEAQENARGAVDRAMRVLTRPDALSLEDRIRWIQILSGRARAVGRTISDLSVAAADSYARYARQLREHAAESDDQTIKSELANKADQYESASWPHSAARALIAYGLGGVAAALVATVVAELFVVEIGTILLRAALIVLGLSAALLFTGVVVRRRLLP